MSKIGEFFESVRDNTVSFALTAIPTFLGTAAIATMFSLGMGLGAAIGLPSALTVVTGLVVAGVTFGGCVGVGALLGLGGLAGAAAIMDKIPGLRGAEARGPGLALGVVAGLAASVALAFNLASGDDPQKDGMLTQPEPVQVTMQMEQNEQADALQISFIEAGSGQEELVVKQAANNNVPAPSAMTLAI